MKPSVFLANSLIVLTALSALPHPHVWAAAPKKSMASPSKPIVESGPKRSDLSSYLSANQQGISLEKLREADKLRIETIASIQKLMNSPGTPNIKKFELYLRLGEIYAERSDYLHTIEMDDFDRASDKWVADGKKGKEPELNSKNSTAELLKSADAFRRLVREFPKHPRTDAALYALAKTLLLLDNDNAVLYFNQLTQSHPRSPLLPETYLALGEYYFFKHDMDKAKENYKKAMTFKESRVYPFALYKLGWAFYNSKVESKNDTKDNTDKSIAAFKLSIKVAEKSQDESSNFNLRQEAINDLIMVFAETERIDEAMDYFSRLGEKEAFYDMLEKLGNIYDENGSTVKAIEVYSRLLKESPNRPRNPDIHTKLVKLYEQSLQPQAVVDTLNTMRSLYVDTISSWRKANETDPKLLEEASEKTRKSVHRYATLYHKDGQKLNKHEFLQASAELYKLYIVTFPQSEETYELRYYLADIYFNFGQYENAADEYLTVAKAKPKDGKYLKNSATNAVVAIRKIDEKTTNPKLPDLGQVPNPIALPRVKQKLVVTIDAYNSLLPGDSAGYPMAFTAAMTFFEYGQYPEALSRFQKIALESPDSEQGKGAIKVSLGYYAEKKDWENLVKLSRLYLDNPKIAKSKQKDEVSGMLKTGIFQLASQLGQGGKLEDSAKMFETFQQQFPTDDNADRALYNASVNYFKIAKVEAAVSAGMKLLKEYPHSKLAPDVTLDLAQSSEALADFKQAAAHYKAYGTGFPKESKSRVALYNAAALYKGLKDYPESIRLYKRYIEFYPKDELSRGAWYEIGEMAEAENSSTDAIQAYGRYASLWPEKSEPSLIGRARVSKLELASGSRKDGLKEIRKLQRDLMSKGAPAALEARKIVAESLFGQMENDFNSYMSWRVSDASKLEQDAQMKQEKLMGLVKSYQDIIELGNGEFTVASLYRMGEMHENFAKVLFEAPSPKDAPQADIDQYRSSIEKVAFPLRDESSKFFEAAYTRSQEVLTFTDWTRKTYEKMNELQPEKFPAVVEKNTSPSYMSHPMVWDETIESIAN